MWAYTLLFPSSIFLCVRLLWPYQQPGICGPGPFTYTSRLGDPRWQIWMGFPACNCCNMCQSPWGSTEEFTPPLTWVIFCYRPQSHAAWLVFYNNADDQLLIRHSSPLYLCTGLWIQWGSEGNLSNINLVNLWLPLPSDNDPLSLNQACTPQRPLSKFLSTRLPVFSCK